MRFLPPSPLGNTRTPLAFSPLLSSWWNVARGQHQLRIRPEKPWRRITRSWHATVSMATASVAISHKRGRSLFFSRLILLEKVFANIASIVYLGNEEAQRGAPRRFLSRAALYAKGTTCNAVVEHSCNGISPESWLDNGRLENLPPSVEFYF